MPQLAVESDRVLRWSVYIVAFILAASISAAWVVSLTAHSSAHTREYHPEAPMEFYARDLDGIKEDIRSIKDDLTALRAQGR